jgi:E3 ubiquitin-protein ligase RNF1/2
MPADNTPPSSPHNVNPHNEEQQHQQQQQRDLSELSPPRQNGHPTDQEPHHLQNGQHQEEGEEGEEEVDIKEQEVQKEEAGVEGGGRRERRCFLFLVLVSLSVFKRFLTCNVKNN